MAHIMTRGWPIGDWLSTLTAAVSRLATLVAFAIGIFGAGTCLLLRILDGGPQQEVIIATSALAVMSVVLLGGSLWRESSAVRERRTAEIAAEQAARKQRYADISGRLHIVSLSIKELALKLERARQETRLDKSVLESATERLVGIMDGTAAVFSMLTGTDCRCTIKVVKTDPARTIAWAHTLARDKRSGQQNARRDDERSRQRHDVIEKNIDFELLYDDKKIDDGYYFNNDLPSGEYYSTSLERESMSHVWTPQARRQWPLTYRSTIVWPIRQIETGREGNTHFIGFLAIDSGSPNVFEKAWDTEVGGTIAEQLFLPLWLYHDIDSRLQTDEEPTETGG